MPEFETKPATSIANDSRREYDELKSRKLAVLCGRNNSGKSFVLRQLVHELGETSSYLGPARYQNFNVLSAISPGTNSRSEKWQHFVDQWRRANQNMDNSPLNLGQAIAELTDAQRTLLFELVDRLLSSETAIHYSIPDNTMSQKYISVDGYNLAFTSSGFRLVAVLLTALFDTDYTHVLIDEPELGLSPETQGILADFILDDEQRQRYFPHIKNIILATHSPLFLDRHDLSCNYFIERRDTQISIRQLKTIQDLNSLQFFLLGNRFENLFLPSAIILVEGPCDYDYVNRLVALRFPNSLISVIHCGGDSRIRDVVHVAKQMLSDIRRSPYADRMFVILDSVHGHGLTEELERMGIAKDNIIVWDANGIEYVYPRDVLEKRFGDFDKLIIEDDRVSANGTVVLKKELSEFVVANMTADHELPSELKERFLNKLDSVIY